MKKVAMLITGLWMMGPVFAQTDVEKRAVTQFQQDFNAAAYEAMYRRFSRDCKLNCVTGKEIPTWDFDVLLGAGGGTFYG